MKPLSFTNMADLRSCVMKTIPIRSPSGRGGGPGGRSGRQPDRYPGASGETREWRPVQFPGVIGWDLSGTVEKLGSGVKGFSVGDQVLALRYMVEAVAAGKLTIPIGSRVPLRNAAEAHAAFAKDGAGKILLLP
jgi:NADPH:quinone reductase-like Zn-dependent oxidoreductase